MTGYRRNIAIVLFVAFATSGCVDSQADPSQTDKPPSNGTTIEEPWLWKPDESSLTVSLDILANQASVVYIPLPNTTSYSFHATGGLAVTEAGPCETGSYLLPPAVVGRFRPGSQYHDITEQPIVIPGAASAISADYSISGGLGSATDQGARVFGLTMAGGSCSNATLNLTISFREGTPAPGAAVGLTGDLVMQENHVSLRAAEAHVPILSYEGTAALSTQSPSLVHAVLPRDDRVDIGVRSVSITAPGAAPVDMTGYRYPGAESGFLRSYAVFLNDQGSVEVTYSAAEPVDDVRVRFVGVSFSHQNLPSILMDTPILSR